MTTVKTEIGVHKRQASNTRFAPTGNIGATDVQRAIEEVSSEVAPTDATYYVTSANANLSAEVVVPAFMQTLLDDTTQGAARTTLGVGTADNPTFAGLFLTEKAAAEVDVAGSGQFWVQTATPNLAMFTDDAGTDFSLANFENLASTTNGLGASLIGIEDAAGNFAATDVEAALAEIYADIGSVFQAWDTNLDQIAALAVTDSNFIVGNGSAWVAESGATVRTSLGLGTGDSPTFTALTVGANGVDVNPGSDTDADIVTVGVTGAPTISWDESADAFKTNKPVVISSDGNGDVTHTIAGASVTSDIEVHSEGATDLGGIAIHRHTDANNFGGHLLFLRSDGTHASPTLVDDGDTLGRMIGLGQDGTDYELAGEIRFVVDGVAANNVMYGAVDIYTNNGGQTLTRRARFRADGSIDVVTGPLNLPNTGLHILDTDASHDLIVAPGSNLTADRTLTLTTGDADRTLDYTSGLPLDNARRAMTRQAVSTSGATLTIDMASGWHVSLSLGHTITTFNVSNAPASGQLGKLTLDITSSGTFAISDWPGTVIWPGGAAPTITDTGVDTIILTTIDGGTNWRGYVAGQDFS